MFDVGNRLIVCAAYRTFGHGIGMRGPGVVEVGMVVLDGYAGYFVSRMVFRFVLHSL
jgi:hypothetical protein